MAWTLKFVSSFGTVHEKAYARVALFAFDRGSQNMRAVFNIYCDADAAKAGKQPLAQTEMIIGKEAQVIQPAVTHPTTGDILIPEVAMPSFDEVMKMDGGENAALYDSVAGSIYSVSKALSAFQAAEKA